MGLLAKPPHGKASIRRGGALVAVVALHLVVLVVAIKARTRVERPVETTVIQMAFLQEENALPEPAPQLPQPPLEQMRPPEIITPQIQIPVIDIPDSRAITAAPPPPPPPAAAPVVARSTEPVQLSEEQVEYLREPDPQYPRAAKLAKLQGKVLVWVLIDTEGRPRDVRVHRSSGHEQLDRAGCDAALRALFKPYRLDGESRSAHVVIPIEFRIGAVRTVSRH
jgi:periplasmic protein TonB